jgi:hypothetical protein
LRLSAFRFRYFFFPFFVIAGHSRSQNGVASLACVRQSMRQRGFATCFHRHSPRRVSMNHRIKSGDDGLWE